MQEPDRLERLERADRGRDAAEGGDRRPRQALRASVRTFPESDLYDLEELLTQLAIGEAAVTVLTDRGTPTPVAWTRLRAPESLMGMADPAAMKAATRPLTTRTASSPSTISMGPRLPVLARPPEGRSQLPAARSVAT